MWPLYRPSSPGHGVTGKPVVWLCSLTSLLSVSLCPGTRLSHPLQFTLLLLNSSTQKLRVRGVKSLSPICSLLLSFPLSMQDTSWSLKNSDSLWMHPQRARKRDMNRKTEKREKEKTLQMKDTRMWSQSYFVLEIQAGSRIQWLFRWVVLSHEHAVTQSFSERDGCSPRPDHLNVIDVNFGEQAVAGIVDCLFMNGRVVFERSAL